MLDRNRIQKTAVIKSTDHVHFGIISVKGDDDVLVKMFSEFEPDTVPIETEHGVVMVQQTLSSDFVLLPDGDYQMNYFLWSLQLNLYQFGLINEPCCLPVSNTVQAQFFSILDISDIGKPFDECLVVLVWITQQALYFFDFLPIDYIDGLACDSTMSALEQFYFEYGPFGGFKRKKPWADLSMIFHVLQTLDSFSKKLKKIGFPKPKNFLKTDPNGLRKQIKAFQKSHGLDTTMKFDKATIHIFQGSNRRKSYFGSNFGSNIKNQLGEITGLGAKQRLEESLNDDFSLKTLLITLFEEGDVFKTPIARLSKNRKKHSRQTELALTPDRRFEITPDSDRDTGDEDQRLRIDLSKSLNIPVQAVANLAKAPGKVATHVWNYLAEPTSNFIAPLNPNQGRISSSRTSNQGRKSTLSNSRSRKSTAQSHSRGPTNETIPTSSIESLKILESTASILSGGEPILVRSKSLDFMPRNTDLTRRKSWGGFECPKPVPLVIPIEEEFEKVISDISELISSRIENLLHLDKLDTARRYYVDFMNQQEAKVLQYQRKIDMFKEIGNSIDEKLSDLLTESQSINYQLDSLQEELKEFDASFSRLKQKVSQGKKYSN